MTLEAKAKTNPINKRWAWFRAKLWQRFLPWFISSLILTGTIVLWRALLQSEEVRIRQAISEKAEAIKTDINQGLDAHVHSMERMARRLDFVSRRIDRNSWEADAALYYKHLPGLQGLGIIDKNYHVLWKYPHQAHESDADAHFDMSSEPRRKAALDLARNTRMGSLTLPVELRSGGKGFLIAYSLFPNGKFSGFVVSGLRIDKFLSAVVALGGYQIALREGGETLFSTVPNLGELDSEWGLSTPVYFGSHAWELRVVPTSQHLQKTLLPTVVLGVGIVLSLFLGLIIQLILSGKRIQRQLENSKALLLEAQQVAKLGRWTWFPDSGKVVWSDIMFELYGMTPNAQPTFELFKNFLHPEDAERTLDTLQIALSSESQSYTLEYRIVRTDGSIRDIYSHGRIERDESGYAHRVIGTAQDITERKQVELGFKETTKMLKTLIDSSPLAILTLDAQGLVKVWNPACERFFGWTEKEALGHPLPFVPPEDREESRRIIEGTLKTDQTIEVETQRRRKDGSLVDVSIAATSFRDKDGKPYGLMAILHDITARKAAERALIEARQQAEKATKAKSEFLANMSHEIRTPMNSIIGMTDLLFDTPLNDEQRRYTSIVQSSGSALLGLINDILDFSKIEAGKFSLEKTQFSLCSVVEGQADLLIAKALEKGLSLMTFVSPNIPDQLVGDPGRLAQVLINLIGNAIKFTLKGGITVRVTPAGGSEEKQDQSPSSGPIQVRFEIEDTGIGLSAATQTKLFKPFTQADGSTARKFGGTGLGLSISKHLVEAMNGQIGVTSAEGEGATFWFNVELGVSEVKLPKHRLRDSVRVRSVRILVADEDKIAGEVIRQYILAWGMRSSIVRSFSGTSDLLKTALLEGDPYHLVIAGTKGDAAAVVEWAGTLRESLGNKIPKLILTTPFERPLDIDDARKQGFSSVLNKPIKQGAIFRAIFDAVPKDLGIAFPETEEIPAHEPENQPSAGVGGGSILVVDDVSANQMLAMKLLEKLGYIGHAVANGKEAINALELRPYDLVLMDCQMPEMDGFEATRRIRAFKNQVTCKIPIIALTANAMEGDEKKCLEAGMNDYLSKPIKKDKLEHMLQKWLSQTRMSKSA